MTKYDDGLARQIEGPSAPLEAPPSEPQGLVGVGQVVKLFVGQGHGFIRIANDREIYFHRTDLPRGTSIRDLRIGDRVVFELLKDVVTGARVLRVAPARHR